MTEEDVSPLIEESQEQITDPQAELEKLIQSYELISVIDAKRAMTNESVIYNVINKLYSVSW